MHQTADHGRPRVSARALGGPCEGGEGDGGPNPWRGRRAYVRRSRVAGGRMSARDCLLLAIMWMGLTVSGAAQTVSFTFDDGPTVDSTPLMSPAERNEALVAHLREKGVQAMF